MNGKKKKGEQTKFMFNFHLLYGTEPKKNCKCLSCYTYEDIIDEWNQEKQIKKAMIMFD